MLPKEGETAPAFSAPDHNGTEHSSTSHTGEWVFLYFYPNDDTPGCTAEACDLRDHFDALSEAGVVVLGVSANSADSHKKFAKKHDLPFALLVDEDRTIIDAYGVWQLKSFMGKEYMGIMRTSFLIEPDGTIAKVYEKVKPEGHAKAVLEDLLTIKERLKPE